MPTETSVPASYEARFVTYVLNSMAKDKGLAAHLRRADNPATEYQSWEFLAGFGIDLEKDRQRLPFVIVAATMARAKTDSNGSLRLGQALASCYSEGNQNNQAKARLRRVLACDDLPELSRILRPVLTLIVSRVSQPLDYVRLLTQLRSFFWDAQRIKAQWAQEFYGRQADGNSVQESTV